LDAAYAEAATPADFPAILEMVRRHEGVDSADIAHHWQQRQALRDFTRPDLLATNPLLPRPTFQHVPPPSQRRHRPGSHCTMAA
jgi:hypothetical protein